MALDKGALLGRPDGRDAVGTWGLVLPHFIMPLGIMGWDKFFRKYLLYAQDQQGSWGHSSQWNEGKNQLLLVSETWNK